ncbi:MAG: S8 family serine peptidase, partial [Sedimentisphaerales bacterium]|nr:S8 family serine peptidase [Sedimentisphaerales bacterium]
MIKTIDETAVWVLKLWVVALVAVLAGGARAQEGASLQPQGLDRAGIYALRQLDPGLSGAGVRFGVVCRSFTYSEAEEPQNDYRPNVGHNCFQTANLHFLDAAALEAGVSPHSTAICSILFGGDPRGIAESLDPFVYEGAVPDAEAYIYEFQHFVTEQVAAESRPDLDVLAASFGYPFETWWTRGIESWAEHEGLIVVASIGNGANVSDPPFYPGAGSNAIGVGVVSSVNTEDAATNLAHFALAYPERSSGGPTDDGRCKPDLIAPGNCLAAGTADEADYITSGNWSSFSTPVAAGVVGLLMQVAKQDAGLNLAVSPRGGNCVLKAI